MNNSSERKYFKENLTKIFSFALIIPFAGFLLHFLASYWDYFDYGINISANLFSLIFYLPIIFVVLLIAVFIGNFISNRANLDSNSFARVLISLLMLIIFSAAMFSVEVWRMRDYPNPNNASVSAFLKDYFGHIL